MRQCQRSFAVKIAAGKYWPKKKNRKSVSLFYSFCCWNGIRKIAIFSCMKLWKWKQNRKCISKMKTVNVYCACMCVCVCTHIYFEIFMWLYIGRVIILIFVYCLLTLCLRRSLCGYWHGINNHMQINIERPTGRMLCAPCTHCTCPTTNSKLARPFAHSPFLTRTRRRQRADFGDSIFLHVFSFGWTFFFCFVCIWPLTRLFNWSTTLENLFTLATETVVYVFMWTVVCVCARLHMQIWVCVCEHGAFNCTRVFFAFE